MSNLSRLSLTRNELPTGAARRLRPVALPSPKSLAQRLPQPTVEHSKLTSGELFALRYQVLDVLGSGGQGEVMRAFDLETDRNVVLKTSRLDLFSEAFEREAGILERELHPMFPTLIEHGQVPGESGRTIDFIAMEEIEGIELRALLNRGPVSLAQALEITMQLLYGLRALHNAGQVHRDLKPANIMIENNGYTRLIDFGLASLDGTRERDGRIAGTPMYLSPEQAGGQPIRASSDLYTLGLILQEMISGSNPMFKANPLQAVVNIRDNEVPMLDRKSIAERLPAEEQTDLAGLIDLAHCQLRGLLADLTERDPAFRIKNADEALERLAEMAPVIRELSSHENI